MRLMKHLFAYETGALMPYQKEARKRVEEMDLPTSKTEAFQHVALSRLYAFDDQVNLKKNQQDFSAFDIVIEDGKLQSFQKREGVTVLKLNQALVSYGAYLDKRLRAPIKKGALSFFPLMNFASHQEGVFIFIHKHTVCKEPMRIAITSSSSYHMPKLFIFADQGSASQWIIESIHPPETLCNGVIDCNLEKDAKLEMHFDNDMRAKALQLMYLKGDVKHHAHLKVMTASTGSALSRIEGDFNLLQSQATCEFFSLGVGRHTDHIHSHIQINHRAPECFSNQLVKHILYDQAKTSFTGKIFVEKVAQQTNAYQLNRNLILSQKASAHAKPGLEIFADDVKASHGATISNIDEELQFYLHSRGLALDDARHFLVRAFTKDILNTFLSKELYQKWHDLSI